MTEAEWTEEEAPPKKKKGIPKWVWFGCGGGCLIVVLLLVVAIVMGANWFQSGKDPEVQWPRLQEVMYFEERPDDVNLLFGTSILGTKQFILEGGDFMVTLTRYGSAQEGEYEQVLNPDFKGLVGLGAPQDAEAGTMMVQGEEVPYMRYSRIKPEPEDSQGAGPGIRIDLTGGRERPRVVDMRRLGSSDPLTDEEIADFLTDFDVWR